jgi:drug/metabolite transporter (DMT)-like permease
MYKGVLLLISAEFCFALATVFAKFVTKNSNISGVEITFFRFFFGFFLALFYMIKTKESFKPKKINLLIQRGVYNSVAVIFFFLAIQYTSITNANMLNLTYPVFIFFVAPFINKEKTNPLIVLFLIFTMAGIFLVVNPDFNKINIGDIFGLLSGITAAFGVASLKEARKYDSTFTILFYLMAIGIIINFFVMIPNFIFPKGFVLVNLVFSALIGVIGQVFITSGYKYIGAKAGSLVSGSRIIFAVILGVCIFSEPFTIKIICGGILILLSIICVSFFSQDKKNANISDI